MNKLKISVLMTVLLFMAVSSKAQTISSTTDSSLIKLGEDITDFLMRKSSIHEHIHVYSVKLASDSALLYCSPNMKDYPFTMASADSVYSIARNFYRGKKIEIYTGEQPLGDMITGFFGSPIPKYKRRRSAASDRPVVIKRLSVPYKITRGLQNRQLCLWHSHGRYYEPTLQRWEWQRARMFETVEDLYPMSYVLPFLAPMLEKAGAVVFLPRERDTRREEVIVDNDVPFLGYEEKAGSRIWKTGDSCGFKNARKEYHFGENPFEMGTYRVVKSLPYSSVSGKRNKEKESFAIWHPDIPEKGEYAVYLSWKSLPNSTDAAYYTVKYDGGQARFKIDQKIGGGVWMYIGTFMFSKGSTSEGVYLSNVNWSEKRKDKKEVVTADAVKFGGGMGNVARKPDSSAFVKCEEPAEHSSHVAYNITFPIDAITSGYPKYTEGSRYWLQTAGFPDTVYSYSHNINDYNDDYVSRGRWVNYLSGSSSVNKIYKGLGIPVDMSLGFHTDAGTFKTDSIVGTLSIYTRSCEGLLKYPDGESRMNGRYLADIVQTQLVKDVRAQFEPKWTRRQLWDRNYSESRTPQVPGMLLEFLSHENFADMTYGLDPAFRFTVSRAIYKGILKYLSFRYKVPYCVEPLPVKDFAALLEKNDGRCSVKLSWKPVRDTLEPTAAPDKYIVYKRTGDGGFDNGTVTADTTLSVPLETNEIYSFKVAAVNAGGESFPSEILSAGVADGSFAKGKTVMIVNDFYRISGPALFSARDTSFAGFNNDEDNGVGYIKDISFIGRQYEFRRNVPWKDDDAPGFGSSYSNYEDKVIAGNTFDYPFIHGRAFLRHGYNFVSVSEGALSDSSINVNYSDYDIMDIIGGKQRQIKDGRGVMPVRYKVFPVPFRKVISDYCKSGGNLIVSGAYIATDLFYSPENRADNKKFASEVLKFKYMTHYASRDGVVKACSNPFGFSGKYVYNHTLNDKMYDVESPDAIIPSGKDVFTIFRYSNSISAGIAYGGTDYKVVDLGFPIETLCGDNEVEALIGEILRFFETERQL
ncbi:MAG: xanthan lyase [Bacteroidales bacterium]|jgi:hypothetical protein|nr:xanthan lyase [Bacteroidales bacterium]